MYPPGGGGAGAESLTYVSLFVVLDEFGELKVPGDDRHLEAETGRAETVSGKPKLPQDQFE